MSELVYRRIAGGRDPVRDILRTGPDGAVTSCRSAGALVGRFALGDALGARLGSLADAVARTAMPESAEPPADRLVEHLEVDGRRLSVPAGTDHGGAWGEALAACREALATTGDPLAVVALEPQLPGRVELVHRGREPLELGFGRLRIRVTWGEDGGLEAGAALDDGEIVAGPGWTAAFDLTPIHGATAGPAEVDVRMAFRDDGIWVPARLAASVAG